MTGRARADSQYRRGVCTEAEGGLGLVGAGKFILSSVPWSGFGLSTTTSAASRHRQLLSQVFTSPSSFLTMASPRPARPRSAPPSMADKHPGAGFEQLELAFCPPSPAPSSPSTPLANYDGYPFSPVASTSRLSPYSTATEDWEAICEQKTQAIVEEVLSPDSLLDRGIADYTVTPGGRLGRGKFSVVYRAEKGGKEVSAT